LSTHRGALSTPLPAGTHSDGCSERYSQGYSQGYSNGYSQGYTQGYFQGYRDRCPKASLRRTPKVLSRSWGTRSTHIGYSEYSQGVLRVLTHLGLPVGCACGGVPITCRETRAPPPGVPSCKPRWALRVPPRVLGVPLGYSQYPMGALTVPPARRRPAVPSCMGNVRPKANTQPQESVQQVRAGGCG
jgi:hypothetical protein